MVTYHSFMHLHNSLLFSLLLGRFSFHAFPLPSVGRGGIPLCTHSHSSDAPEAATAASPASPAKCHFAAIAIPPISGTESV